MSDSIVLQKAIKFALRIVGVYKYLTDEKKEFVLQTAPLVGNLYCETRKGGVACVWKAWVFVGDVSGAAKGS
jgi:hypothetical protein